MGEKHIFIIKTDQYAGNFERELCAYCTGVVGDCGVGEEERNKFIDDYSEEKADEMWELLEQRFDDNGCARPVSVGFPNTTLEIYFHSRPTREVINMIKERANKFELKDYKGSLKPLSILGFRMKKETTTIKSVDI